MKNVVMLVFLLSAFAYSQMEADLYYGVQKNNKFFLKTGAGIGAAYGGWYGLGTEVGYGIISVTAGLGKIYANSGFGSKEVEIGNTGKLGWQVGLKLYFNAEKNSFRPALAVHYGRVYPYAIFIDDERIDGLYNGITPCLIFENKLGKKQKVGLTYGIGPVFHKQIPEKDKRIIQAVNGKERNINLSLVFGINILII